MNQIESYVASARQAVENAEIDLKRLKEVNDRKANQRWKKRRNQGIALERQNRDIQRLGRAEKRLIQARQFLKACEEGAVMVREAAEKELAEQQCSSTSE